MSKRFWVATSALAVVASVGWRLLDVAAAQTLPPASPVHSLSQIKPLPGAPNLNPTRNGHTVHIMPTVQGARALAKAGALAGLSGGPLTYHGGPIMRRANFFAIFWIPSTLQNGGPTGMSVAYQNLQTRLLADYTANGIDNNNVQYYQILGSTKSYIQNAAGLMLANGLAGVFVDNSPYPASGCTDIATPGNCITDAQIQAEIQKVIALAGWSSGPNRMFLLYTSSGEGSCTDSSSSICAYTDYCAYHSFIGTSPPTIYANIPFGNLSVCPIPTSPNGDAVADAVTSTASHEVTDAITDPLMNAWFDSMGNEIADICHFDFGTNGWDAGLANQQWGGHFYELQQEFDNHTGGCVQLGP